MVELNHTTIQNINGIRSHKKISWADVIIIIRKRLLALIKKKFKIKNKNIIVLDVTDSKQLIPKEFRRMRLLNHKEFNKQYTYP